MMELKPEVHIITLDEVTLYNTIASYKESHELLHLFTDDKVRIVHGITLHKYDGMLYHVAHDDVTNQSRYRLIGPIDQPDESIIFKFAQIILEYNEEEYVIRDDFKVTSIFYKNGKRNEIIHTNPQRYRIRDDYVVAYNRCHGYYYKDLCVWKDGNFVGLDVGRLLKFTNIIRIEDVIAIGTTDSIRMNEHYKEPTNVLSELVSTQAFYVKNKLGYIEFKLRYENVKIEDILFTIDDTATNSIIGTTPNRVLLQTFNIDYSMVDIAVHELMNNREIRIYPGNLHYSNDEVTFTIKSESDSFGYILILETVDIDCVRISIYKRGEGRIYTTTTRNHNYKDELVQLLNV